MSDVVEFPYERIISLVRDEVSRGLESVRLEVKSSGEITNLGIAGINQRLDKLNGKTDRTALTVAEHETRLAVITGHCEECNRPVVDGSVVGVPTGVSRGGMLAGMALGFCSAALVLIESVKYFKEFFGK